MPNLKNIESNKLVRNVVTNLDDIIILNDEAHHIHDSKRIGIKLLKN